MRSGEDTISCSLPWGRAVLRGLEREQHGAVVDLLANVVTRIAVTVPAHRGADHVFHLHGFHHHQRFSGRDVLSERDAHINDERRASGP